MVSTPACQPGATSTRRSVTGAANTPATRTGTGSARCTSTRSRVSGRCCALGSARIGASRKRSCRTTSASSSSYTTRAAGAKLSSAPSSRALSPDVPVTTPEPDKSLGDKERVERDPNQSEQGRPARDDDAVQLEGGQEFVR